MRSTGSGGLCIYKGNRLREHSQEVLNFDSGFNMTIKVVQIFFAPTIGTATIFFYSWFHLYGYCLLHIATPVSPFLLSFFLSVSPFFHCLPARGPPFENVRPQPFSPMLYRICTRAQENCGKPVPIHSAISQSLYPVHSL